METRPDVLTAFGARLRALHKARGMSQEALGLETGLEQPYVSDIERGTRNVSLRNLHAIACALGVTLAELFEGIE